LEWSHCHIENNSKQNKTMQNKTVYQGGMVGVTDDSVERIYEQLRGVKIQTRYRRERER
jgi:hypothetical protein